MIVNQPKLNWIREDHLPEGVLSFSIVQDFITETYHNQGIPYRVCIGVEWTFEATVLYHLWLELEPYTQNKNIVLESVTVNFNHVTTVSFTLKGFGKKAPSSFELSEGFIPIGNKTNKYESNPF